MTIAGDGLRCLGGAVQPDGSRVSDPSGGIGPSTPGWGPPSAPAQGVAAQGGFAAGATRHLQLSFRDDPASGCGHALDTSQAVTVRFRP